MEAGQDYLRNSAKWKFDKPIYEIRLNGSTF
jgi:hypothetical protein